MPIVAASVPAGRTGEPDPDVGAVLIELSGSIEPVRPNRSRWTTLAIAAFAGLTCLGLAGTTLFPRVTDRASERRDVTTASATDADTVDGPAGTVPAEGRGDRPGGSAALVAPSPVVATWRLVGGRDDRQLFVSGAASRQVERIAVDVAIGGRSVASADVVPLAEDRGRDDVIPWSVVIDMPRTTGRGDAVATVAVSWVGRVATSGSLAAAVVLGDGRSGTTGH